MKIIPGQILVDLQETITTIFLPKQSSQASSYPNPVRIALFLIRGLTRHFRLMNSLYYQQGFLHQLMEHSQIQE
jgi:hypothetical protein